MNKIMKKSKLQLYFHIVQYALWLIKLFGGIIVFIPFLFIPVARRNSFNYYSSIKNLVFSSHYYVYITYIT